MQNAEEYKEIDGLVLPVDAKSWQAICEGRKNLEVRKAMPTAFSKLVKRDGFMRCYVYVIGSNRVKGYFDCKQIVWSNRASDILHEGKTCMTLEQIAKCSASKTGKIYGWRIENVKVYDEPLPLSVFGMENPPRIWSYCYL